MLQIVLHTHPLILQRRDSFANDVSCDNPPTCNQIARSSKNGTQEATKKPAQSYLISSDTKRAWEATRKKALSFLLLVFFRSLLGANNCCLCAFCKENPSCQYQTLKEVPNLIPSRPEFWNLKQPCFCGRQSFEGSGNLAESVERVRILHLSHPARERCGRAEHLISFPFPSNSIKYIPEHWVE